MIAFGHTKHGTTKYFMTKNPILLHFSTSSLVSSRIDFDSRLSNPRKIIYFHPFCIWRFWIVNYVCLLSLKKSLTLLKNDINFAAIRIVLAKERKTPVHEVAIYMLSMYSWAPLASWKRNIHCEMMAGKIVNTFVNTLSLNGPSSRSKPIELKLYCATWRVRIVTNQKFVFEYKEEIPQNSIEKNVE